MLSYEAIREHLTHPEPAVRAAVARYVGHGGAPAPVLLHAALDACDRDGVTINRPVLWHFVDGRLGAPEVQRLLALMRRAHDPDDVFLLGRIIATSTLDRVEDWIALLCPADAVESSLRAELDHRRDLARRPVRELWRDLRALGRSSGRFLSPEDEDRAEELVTAIVDAGGLPERDLVRALEDDELRVSWLGYHVVELAARQRAPAAAPHLVDRLDEWGDAMAASAIRGLGYLGDPRAARRIEAEYERRSRNFRIDGVDALSRIKHPESEAVALRLLARETDPEQRARLCVALCRQFSVPGLQVARDALATGELPRELFGGDELEPVLVGDELAVAAAVVESVLRRRARRRAALAVG